jgi:hypothetical protein
MKNIFQYEDENLKIRIKLKKNSPKLLANADLIFNSHYGFITIKDFQIWRSDYFNERVQAKINIKPPSRNNYGHYTPYIFIENENSWHDIERLIGSAYFNAANKLPEEEIDVDVLDEDSKRTNE